MKDKTNKVIFTINGQPYEVSDNIPSDTSLNTYIRDHANLKGTKSMCHEGGCGACIVAVTSVHPVTKKENTYAVNSCLLPVLSCDGCHITTVEGIGDKQNGYHPVQARLARFNGTQCGYCSPGMVMNMYSLLQSNPKITMAEVENSFGGNICRCTGYRPILDAFKSLCEDGSPKLKEACKDIEDICNIKVCSTTGKRCIGTCSNQASSCKSDKNSIHISNKESEWFKVKTVDEIFEIFDTHKDPNIVYRFVAGNTAQGVYRITKKPQLYIDIHDVEELRKYDTDNKLVLGANLSLTEAMAIFDTVATKNSNFSYAKTMEAHINKIANVPVRNTGTLGGNLMMKHEVEEFPSDIFLIFETVGATLVIAEKKDGKIVKQTVGLEHFLKHDMTRKIIHSIQFPALGKGYYLKTYKIMPRYENAHAYVNAGFLIHLDESKNHKVIGTPRIVYGGINPKFIHAKKTELYLEGKELGVSNTVKCALKVLSCELEPDHVLPDATPEYRKGLAEALFYKTVLYILPESAQAFYKSGGNDLQRPLSSGEQNFQTDKADWPLNQPVPKLEAVVQCSGEGEYVNDIPTFPGELHGALVLASELGTIQSIDASKALEVQGVRAFLEAEDIPGKNTYTPIFPPFNTEEEEVFCSSKVRYVGQPIGLIVADTQTLANSAVKLVHVSYTDVRKPVLTIKECLKAPKQEDRVRTLEEETLKSAVDKNSVQHVLKGEFEVGSQYHYTMETQTCLCVPIEDGLDVYPASQWMDMMQVCIADALNIKVNSINMKVRRVGGAYGAKISRSICLGVACAVAAHKLNKPVRTVMTLESNMEAFGKRYPTLTEYEVGVNDEGKIQYLKAIMTGDSGCTYNEPVFEESVHLFKNCYESKSWALTGKAVKTDTPSNTYCRAPGTTEGLASIETIMEHIAKVLNKDPLQIRMKNMDMTDSPLPQLIEDLKKSSCYDSRKKNIEEFNKQNRWRKRGIAIVPMKYPFKYFGGYNALVSIYRGDGTVSVTHAGIEIGQGINTKVAQVVAYTLGIPLEMVSVKPSNSLTAPNGMVTGGSITSEACVFAARNCCLELNERLKPIKAKMEKAAWKDIILAAFAQNVDLCATYMFKTNDAKQYLIWGVTSAEVEVDILTGQQQILRVDILEDAGKSLSPEIDIGQVEGAFVMGLGYWLLEYVVYDPKTGALLTNRTWNYKPPGARDIPINFNIELRKDAPNPYGVLRSKASGEPPLCMSSVVMFAIRHALDSARKDAGLSGWWSMDAPFTVENIRLHSGTTTDQFTL